MSTVAKTVKTHTNVELEQIDYVNILVGNAYHAMHFFRTMFGFNVVAYSGLETGARDRISYVLTQGSMRLIVTSALDSESAIANEIRKHGDGVKEIAFTVKSAAETFDEVISRGACPVAEPAVMDDDFGQVTTATVKSFDNQIHTFVQRDGYAGTFLPGYRPFMLKGHSAGAGLLHLDHIAMAFPANGLNEAVEYYTGVLDLEVKHEENIVTQYSAMNSKVVQNKSMTVRFPMMEPGPGQRTSQIEEYLKYHNGAGVQHLAFSCMDIIETVRTLEKAGVEFLKTPKTYYDLLTDRVGDIDQDVAALRDLNILVDRDEWGYLLQIFTRPITGRPTLFCELIQREGARGFGSGNIRALFHAVEREQALRGNL